MFVSTIASATAFIYVVISSALWASKFEAAEFSASLNFFESSASFVIT